MRKRNKVRISESTLREIIHSSIQGYLNSLKGEGYGVIDGGRVDIKIDPIKNTIENFLEEGLISTYPCDRTINMLCKKYFLESWRVQKNIRKDIDENIPLITVILDKNTDNNRVGSIINFMNACGYFAITKFLINKESPNYGTITFEPKFTEDISDDIREKYKVLYHSTPAILLNKIKKNGLMPCSKNSLFMYPDRVYCMKGNSLTMDQVRALYRIQMERNSTHPEEKNPNERLKYVLLTIDVSKIPDNVKIYKDPTLRDSFYTYDNIPPYAIVVETPFTLSWD